MKYSAFESNLLIYKWAWETGWKPKEYTNKFNLKSEELDVVIHFWIKSINWRMSLRNRMKNRKSIQKNLTKWAWETGWKTESIQINLTKWAWETGWKKPKGWNGVYKVTLPFAWATLRPGWLLNAICKSLAKSNVQVRIGKSLAKSNV